MRKRLQLTLGAVTLALCFAVATEAASAASDDQPSTPTKKTVRHHHKYRSPQPVESAGPYSHLEPFRSFGFRGDFPGDCAYMQASGTCMIDLGYGRCMPCEQGGGGGRP